MLEFSDKNTLNRVKLLESLSRTYIHESKRFQSIYADVKDEHFTPIKFELVKENLKYNFKIIREFMTDFTIDSAYTLEDVYLGLESDAKYYCIKRGIHVEAASSKSRIGNIGKCVYLNESHKDYGKYFGWSHRAIFGFRVNDGYKVKKGDCLEGYFPLGYKAKTEDDCREMAIAFAKSVS